MLPGSIFSISNCMNAYFFISNGSKLSAKIFRVDDETEMTELLKTFNSSKENCMN